MSELDSGREPCPAGCGHEAEAALRESAAGEAQSGLLDCPEAPPAGCAAAPERQGGRMARDAPGPGSSAEPRFVMLLLCPEPG